VDPLPPERLDDLLPETAQGDPVAGEFGGGLGHGKEIPAVGVGVEAEQQVGRREVEEAEGVRLHDLRQIDHPAQLDRHRGDRHGHDLVTRLGRGDQVAHRADAADAGHERRHLVHRAPLADPLEAAELCHGEVGVGDVSAFVEVQGDPGVTFDPGDRIDHDLGATFAAHAWTLLSVNRTGARGARRAG
jgi:hypothetical protein